MAQGILTIAVTTIVSFAAICTPFAQQEGTPAIGSRQDAELVATLIRSTLIALHHANVTGNYTVLRDLGAPTFRERNSAVDLGRIFASIRARGIDLETVAVLQPKIDRPPQIDANGMLIVAGSFETQPVPVRFELAFQLIDRAWRLFGLSVGLQQPMQAPADLASPTQGKGQD